MATIDLQGKVALVTGGSRGIGQAITVRLVETGAAVVLTYQEQREAAAAVVDTITRQKGRALACRVDVRDRGTVAAAVATAENHYGGLDILVNNAGINNPSDFDKITDQEWDEIMAVNLKGPFIVMQEALGAFKRRGGGSVINIGSVSGQYGGPRTAHYAASKAGLISLGQVMARFGAVDNIRCNTVAAGLVESEMADAALSSAAVSKLAGNILLKRLGTLGEVADAVAFLASDASTYITAQTLNVNGGLYF